MYIHHVCGDTHTHTLCERLRNHIRPMILSLFNLGVMLSKEE